MNALEQDSSLLIGSAQDIESLARKDSAEIIVASDSHGGGAQLLGILTECGRQADAFIFCGDGMSELCGILHQASEESGIRELLPPVIAVVQGNNDIPSYPLQTAAGVAELRVPVTQTVCACGHTLFITHGHHFSLYGGTQELSQVALASGADTVFYGHTHVAAVEYSNSVFLLNPGSCRLPRGGQPPCYARFRVRTGAVPPDFTFFQLKGKPGTPYTPPPRTSYW